MTRDITSYPAQRVAPGQEGELGDHRDPRHHAAELLHQPAGRAAPCRRWPAGRRAPAPRWPGRGRRRSAARGRRCRTRGRTRRAMRVARQLARACARRRSRRRAPARSAPPSTKPRASIPSTTSGCRGRAQSREPVHPGRQARGALEERHQVVEEDPRVGVVRDPADGPVDVEGAGRIRAHWLAIWRSSEISIRWRMCDGEGGQALERLERLAPALRVARAQAHGQELLQQARPRARRPPGRGAGGAARRRSWPARGRSAPPRGRSRRSRRRRRRRPGRTPRAPSAASRAAPVVARISCGAVAAGRGGLGQLGALELLGLVGDAERPGGGRLQLLADHPQRAGTRRAAGAGSCAGARPRAGCRAGSRPRCAWA